MKKVASGSTEAEEVSFTKDGNVYYLTEDFNGELGTTYILELTYTNPFRSNPSDGSYFVRQGNYPFGFYLKNADISAFEETILKRENESISIDKFFPGFLDWSISGGTTNQDWYLRPNQ